MISVLILYPKSEGSTFDLDYYTSKHMPLFVGHLGDAATGWGVVAPHGDAHHCVGWVTIESKDALDAAMREHGAEIVADVANYTTAAPQMIIGDVVAVPG